MRLTLTTALALALLSSLIPGGNRGMADDDAKRDAPPGEAPAGNPPVDESAKR